MFNFTKSASILFVSLLPATGIAQDYFDVSSNPGFYFKALGGWSDVVNIQKNTPDELEINASFNNGWTIGSSIGYEFNPCIRGELEFAYRDSKGVDVSGGGGVVGLGDQGGVVNSYSVMTNWFASTRPIGQLTPYVGIGIGLSADDVRLPTVETTNGTGTVTNVHFDGGNLAYQAMIGTRFRLSHNVEWITEYRYYGTDSFQLHGSSGDLNAHIRSHNILGGLSFKF